MSNFEEVFGGQIPEIQTRTIDTHKACQYCGKPFESEMIRGTAEGKPLGAPLLAHERMCPKNPQRKRWPVK